MSGLDIEGVLAGHAPKGGVRDLRQHCVCGWDSEERAGKTAHRAHVAAVLREQIADWLLGDEAYREVAFRSILNEGAAWTALRTLAALVAPGLVSRAACGTCGGATAVTDGETVCVSGSRLPHPPTTRTSSPSRVPGEET